MRLALRTITGKQAPASCNCYIFTQIVDDLLDRLTGYFDQEEELDPRDIRGALFKSARRKKSYDEAQVDAFLAVAASVLMSVQ